MIVQIDQTLLEKGEEPIKFLLIGLSGVFVNYLVLIMLREILRVPEEVGVAMAILISMTSNYTFNRIWTFKSSAPIPYEYAKYVGSNFLGALIQYITTILIVFFGEENGFATLNFVIEIPIVYIGTFVGIGLGFISNFLFSKYFVFSKMSD